MKHDLLRRFAYIETCLYWGEGVTAPHLAQVFAIARQNAQKVIEKYRQQYPEAMIYNRSKRRHIATDEFEPQIISTRPNPYLDYIGAISMVEYYWDEKVWNDVPFENDDRYLKPPQQTGIVKTVLSAIRSEQALHLVYRSKKEVQSFVASAHHLVYANYRYHLRAYHHDKDWFVDLVLTRIIEANPADKIWVSANNDLLWNEYLTLHFEINPDLPPEVQEALQADYSLGVDRVRTITVRRAMLGYICREMERVDWRHGKRLWLDKDNCCYQKND